jgi:NADP-dependent 3-hydroxy acid dehydrogenase YdfG
MTAAGYTVVATARRVEALKGLHAAVRLPLDVTSDESVTSAVADVKALYGRIDVLVNNAGFATRAAVEELDDATLRSMFDVNVFGLMRVTRAVAPTMRARGSGTIVNVSSVSGLISIPVNGGYSATKFAVEALSDAARQELAPFGVDVLLIEPGPINTCFEDTARRTSSRFAADATSPYHRLYAAEEKASAATHRAAPGPEAVSRVVLRALAAKRPKARYRAGAPWGLGIALAMPDRMLDRAIATLRAAGRG